MKRLKIIIQRYVLGKSPDQIEMEHLLRNGLKVGKNTQINSGFSIDSAWPWLVSIGDDVTISTNVTILAHDASPNVVKCGTKLGRVSIGNNVFIGTGTTVLCNVRIGDNVIIGAKSLVTCDLPSNGVYVGVPAKRICSIEEYRDKYQELRKARPDFSNIRPWNEWTSATEEERKEMLKGLEDGIGFV